MAIEERKLDGNYFYCPSNPHNLEFRKERVMKGFNIEILKCIENRLGDEKCADDTLITEFVDHLLVKVFIIADKASLDGEMGVIPTK